jgi:NAD(P)-dependent dehydrogenase (short-subunit alcohol dehydrogenase family)
MKLQDKTAFITGGNSGIGLATARLFIAEGARVAITGRNQETLDAAVRELGAGTVGLKADANDLEAADAAIEEAAKQLGGFDIVFANAGIGGTTPLGTARPETFEAILKTNVTAVFFTIQSALPHLKPGAAVVATGSVHANAGAPGYSAYAASKAGLRAMVRVLAAELSPRGMRINMVSPGPVETPIWGRSGRSAAELEALEKRIRVAVPMERYGTADEVAAAVLFLASSDSSYIQGADLAIDGGMNATPLGAPVYR